MTPGWAWCADHAQKHPCVPEQDTGETPPGPLPCSWSHVKSISRRCASCPESGGHPRDCAPRVGMENKSPRALGGVQVSGPACRLEMAFPFPSLTLLSTLLHFATLFQYFLPALNSFPDGGKRTLIGALGLYHKRLWRGGERREEGPVGLGSCRPPVGPVPVAYLPPPRPHSSNSNPEGAGCPLQGH